MGRVLIRNCELSYMARVLDFDYSQRVELFSYDMHWCTRFVTDQGMRKSQQCPETQTRLRMSRMESKQNYTQRGGETEPGTGAQQEKNLERLRPTRCPALE